MNPNPHSELDVNDLMSKVRHASAQPRPAAQNVKQSPKPSVSPTGQESFNRKAMEIMTGLSRVCGEQQENLLTLKHYVGQSAAQVAQHGIRLDEHGQVLERLTRFAQRTPPVYLGKGRLFVQTTHGLPLIVPADDLQITASLITTGSWDPHLTRIYQRAITSGMAYLEVGTHVGYFATLAAALVGHHGKVHAFEPNPGTFDFLETNMRLNMCSYISRLIPQAASNETGRTSFHVFEKSRGSSTLSELPEQLLEEWSERPRSIEVQCTKLDDFYLNETIQFDFIKIDAEGAEPLIFEGGTNFFQQRVKPEAIIAMEFNPPAIQGLKREPGAFAQSLLNAGFNLWRIRDGDQFDPVTAANQLDPWCITELLMTRAKTLPAW